MIYIIYFFIHLHTHTYILHMQIYAWKTYTFYVPFYITVDILVPFSTVSFSREHEFQ